MEIKIALKNSDVVAIMDKAIYDKLKNTKAFVEHDIMSNLSLHKSGYVWFQKAGCTKKGQRTDRICVYLHRAVAELYVPSGTKAERQLVTFRNGRKHDCRVDNLRWITMSELKKA